MIYKKQQKQVEKVNGKDKPDEIKELSVKEDIINDLDIQTLSITDD